MIHKVNVVKKIAFLLMTMALAGAIVACQGTVTSPATVAKEIGDIEFDVGGSAKTFTLTDYFNVTNPEYSATSSNESVAAESVSGAVLTVTPKGAGTANVEVTADGDEGKVSQTFTVTVNAPTVIVNKAPTVRTISPVSLQVAGTKPIELSDYFTDPEGDALTYTAASSDDSVATVTKGAASMITITAVAAGPAEITVSASDGTNAAVSQTFDVMVSETPPPNERPTSLKPFEDVTLTVVDDPTEQIDLSGYFDDADDEDLTYTAPSSNDMYATATVDGSMLTITAVAAGTATITVTASDGKEFVSREIDVTVNKESNKAPVLVAGLSRDVFVMVGGAAKTVDLSQYFRDPEGDALTYGASSSNDMYATATRVGSILTVTPGTAAGTATITATASDGELSASLDLMVTVSATPNVAPEVSVSGIPDQSLEMDFMMTKTLDDLSTYFSDSDSGPIALTYDASSDMEMYATAKVDGSMLTITAVAAGSAMITVTATDGAANVSDTFTVTVTNPAVPTRTSELPDPVFDHDDKAPLTFKLSGYFSGATDYAAVSDDESVVKATEEDGVLTLTPGDAGHTGVTITPSNSGGDGEFQSITVIVKSMPVPKGINPLQDQTIVSDAKPMTIVLSEYFSGATDYDVGSSNEAVLTASKDGGTLTLTPHMYGVAAVTVTPFNDGGTASPQTFDVTVQARPTLKLPLKDLRLDNKKFKALVLSMHFEDPDGSIAKYSTVTSDATKVAVYKTPPADKPKTPSDLDKAANGATVTLHARAIGTATIKVTVTDSSSSKLTATAMFEVTVVKKNNSPTATDGVLPYVKGTRLMLDGGAKKVIDDKAISLYFDDDDLTTDGDLLTFDVKYVVTGGTPTADDLDSDKIVATATISVETWNGDIGGKDKFTVMVTPVKGGPPHDILIVATDLAGATAYKTIQVQVNRPPLAEGDQNLKPWKLSEYQYAVGLSAGSESDIKITLVEAGGGYFHDDDADDKTNLTCTAVPSVTGTTAPAIVKMDSNKLSLTVATKYTTELVPMTVTVRCRDGWTYKDKDNKDVSVVGEWSPSQTFTVSVTQPGKGGSVQ